MKQRARALGLVLVACISAYSCYAQVPSCTLYWEASDGGVWTRNLLNATNQLVHVRLLADWRMANGNGFGYTRFDGVVSNADALDVASNIVRPSPFAFDGQTVVASRPSASIIKIDDSRDASAPGAGGFWVSSGQAPFGMEMNHDSQVVVFTFDLTLSNVAGTRHMGSVHQPLTGVPGNTVLWDVNQVGVHVASDIVGLDIRYVPAPGSLVVCGVALATVSRRRRDSF